LDIVQHLNSFDERKPICFGTLGRAILLTTSELAALFLAETYKAVILAFLIMPTSSPGIRTIFDAVTKGRASFIATEADGALAEYIRYDATQPGSSFQMVMQQDRLIWCPGQVIGCGRRVEQYFQLCQVDECEG
jgi:hypothetical protein